MASIVPVSFVTEDLPTSNKAGTTGRKVRFYATGTTVAAADFVNLTTYISNISAIDTAIVTTAAAGVVAGASYAAGSVVVGTINATAFGMQGIVTLT